MTPPDALRELAERAGLLRPCERLHAFAYGVTAGGMAQATAPTSARVFTGPACPICGGTQRRPPTLEEVLEAVAELHERAGGPFPWRSFAAYLLAGRLGTHLDEEYVEAALTVLLNLRGIREAEGLEGR